MPKTANHLKDGVRSVYAEFLTRKLPLIFLSLVLFAGGIALLALRIPGWGLVLGLPAVQGGNRSFDSYL